MQRRTAALDAAAAASGLEDAGMETPEEEQRSASEHDPEMPPSEPNAPLADMDVDQELSWPSKQGPAQRRRQRHQERDVCAVCLEPHTDACRTACGHLFCRACIELSLERTNRRNCPLCRRAICHFSVRSCSTGGRLREPEVTSPLEGTVFVQSGRIGLASYHFGRDKCFIHYKPGVISDDWLLDDGSLPPEQKEFSNWTYHEGSRTFEGAVVWHPATFRGDRYWAYTLSFDEGFLQITGGMCHMVKADGQVNSYMFAEHCKYRRVRDTIFDAIYVQRHARVGCASYHFLRSGSYVDFSDPPEWWQSQMAPGFPSKLPFADARFDGARREFIGSIDISSTPFGNEVRWEYRMRFDEALSCVESGAVTAFAADGTVVDTRPYSRHGAGVEEALEYVLLEPWDL